ncbi:hypothetical protein [Rheinheimera soli]|jgi:hypothetical protein|uniref:Termination factor Rho n=1 Tax=Rheinheimera soli TaxID=443616 RepID=A0ABU1VVP1_9GAMM|nr:hypothetical protein [Rheinheimera soli]MDR7119640.1 hypothetical protein [Rheinheimera soli]
MAAGSKEKYTKDQRKKATYLEENEEEKAVPYKKNQPVARPTIKKGSGADELAASGTRAAKREKHTKRKNSAKNADKTQLSQAEPGRLEQEPIDTLRKKARKKHISGSSSMTQLELIHALRSR